MPPSRWRRLAALVSWSAAALFFAPPPPKVSAQSCPNGGTAIGPCDDSGTCPEGVCNSNGYCCVSSSTQPPVTQPTQPPPPTNCGDRASTCANVAQYCQTDMYLVCMIRNCRRTCGYCFGGTAAPGAGSAPAPPGLLFGEIREAAAFLADDDPPERAQKYAPVANNKRGERSSAADDDNSGLRIIFLG